MKATITIEGILKFLESLNLSADNQKWLAERLLENAEKTDRTEYINKDELLSGIRQGLAEVKESKTNGKRQKTLQEVIDEL